MKNGFLISPAFKAPGDLNSFSSKTTEAEQFVPEGLGSLLLGYLGPRLILARNPFAQIYKIAALLRGSQQFSE